MMPLRLSLHSALLFAVVLVFILFGECLFAHQQKEAYSRILVNQRSALVEISHRFYIHDAEHALVELNGKQQDLLNNEQARIEFTDYIVGNFAMRDNNGDPVLLETVGYEVEGKYFWVYQQTEISPLLNKLSVKMTSLQDVWHRQINYINLDKEGKTQSVRLLQGDGWQMLH